MRLAGHLFDERDLIERVMRNLEGPIDNTLGRPRWAVVHDTFAVGSTVANALCREFGLDPNEYLIHPGADELAERFSDLEDDDDE